jgi:hypothetical protein
MSRLRSWAWADASPSGQHHRKADFARLGQLRQARLTSLGPGRPYFAWPAKQGCRYPANLVSRTEFGRGSLFRLAGLIQVRSIWPSASPCAGLGTPSGSDGDTLRNQKPPIHKRRIGTLTSIGFQGRPGDKTAWGDAKHKERREGRQVQTRQDMSCPSLAWPQYQGRYHDDADYSMTRPQ